MNRNTTKALIMTAIMVALVSLPGTSAQKIETPILETPDLGGLIEGADCDDDFCDDCIDLCRRHCVVFVDWDCDQTKCTCGCTGICT